MARTSENISMIETETDLSSAPDCENYEVHATPLCGPIMFKKEVRQMGDPDFVGICTER